MIKIYSIGFSPLCFAIHIMFMFVFCLLSWILYFQHFRFPPTLNTTTKTYSFIFWKLAFGFLYKLSYSLVSLVISCALLFRLYKTWQHCIAKKAWYLVLSKWIFQHLDAISHCTRFNMDYFDKIGDGWDHVSLIWLGTQYPPPINWHNQTNISKSRWIHIGVRNPEESPDYTA